MKLPPRPGPDFFSANRQVVMEKLQGGILVVAGYTGMQRTNDEEAIFIQEGNFWYLTGVEFANWWLIIDAMRQKSWLVEPVIDERHRLFTESLLADEAKKSSGIHDVISHDEAMSMLRTAAKKHKLVYTVAQPAHSDNFGFTLNPAAKNLHDSLTRTFTSVRDFYLELSKIRAIKQPIELTWMQSAIDLTIQTLSEIKKDITKYKNEYEIEAELGYAFRRTGADGHAFDPIVASGKNGATIHYFSNNSPIKKGSLVMLDVGARVNGYAADLTRTFAVTAPTKRMVQVHGAVQNAQSRIIDLIKPGLSVEEYQKNVDMIIKEEMAAIKVISSIDDDEGFRRRMAHSVSHGLGIDVHESLGRPKYFEPGMVLTVEPGIYIPEEGIGVRIEDDILVTSSGYKNLSAKLSSDL
jgi:Xaa-Pro aminopeptidase